MVEQLCTGVHPDRPPTAWRMASDATDSAMGQRLPYEAVWCDMLHALGIRLLHMQYQESFGEVGLLRLDFAHRRANGGFKVAAHRTLARRPPWKIDRREPGRSGLHLRPSSTRRGQVLFNRRPSTHSIFKYSPRCRWFNQGREDRRL